MSDVGVSKSEAIPAQPLRLLDRLARRAVCGSLRRIRHGRLELREGPRTEVFGRPGAADDLQAVLQVADPRFYRAMAFGGSVGAAEAYMDGYWTCDDLTAAVQCVIRNRAALEGMESGLGRSHNLTRRLVHALRRNTRSGSHRNITAHYDLGNEFFELFLDGTMTYSCGIFERPQSTLEEASIAKLDRVCRKLQLSPADHVLEIGTGWGSFAMHAAGRYGARVTTTTISPRQYELARQRIDRAGLADRVEVLLQDYRDLRGAFDKLVSIEMIEAVGYPYFDTYFRACSDLLKPEGMMLLQAITVADQDFDRARSEVDFIKRYIFPGACIPSVAAICRSVARATDLTLFHMEAITPHYATTLQRWRERFLANVAAVRRLGHSEQFIRMWEYYLCYCEAGFRERYIGDVQMLLTKPLCRRAPLLPPLSNGGA